MDPDANLREQRNIIERINGDLWSESGEPHPLLPRLAELVKALDEWICNHGVLPQDWADSRQYDRPESVPCHNCGAT